MTEWSRLKQSKAVTSRDDFSQLAIKEHVSGIGCDV